MAQQAGREVAQALVAAAAERELVVGAVVLGGDLGLVGALGEGLVLAGAAGLAGLAAALAVGAGAIVGEAVAVAVGVEVVVVVLLALVAPGGLVLGGDAGVGIDPVGVVAEAGVAGLVVPLLGGAAGPLRARRRPRNCN